MVYRAQRSSSRVAVVLLAVVAAASAVGCASGDEPAEAKPAAAMPECMPAEHPGSIEFVDEEKNTTKVEPLAKVPESLHYRKDAQGRRIPVVKVVYRRLGPRQAEITLYGPCGQFLESTIGFTQG